MSAEFPWGYESASGPTIATIVGGVRKDVPTAIADADGDLGPLQLDALGNLRVATGGGGGPAYSAIWKGLVGATSCTDLVIINGSATKTVFVQEIRFGATATAAKSLNALLIKRSTANTGGTSSAAPAVPHNADAVAATAAILLYTAVPTVGTPVGTIRATRFTISVVDVVGAQEVIWNLRDLSGGQGLRLEGVAQGLALNLDTTTPGTGNLFTGSITWTELPLSA